MKTLLESAGLDITNLASNGPAPVHFPFLWVFGRKDSTISVMGANIYPEDLECALYADPELAPMTTSFRLGAADQPNGAIRPGFAFEIRGEPGPDLQRAFARHIAGGISEINADYREALMEYPEAASPIVEIHRAGTGPFAFDAGRIKQRRVFRMGS